MVLILKWHIMVAIFSMCVQDVYHILLEIGDQRPTAGIDDFGVGG